MIEEVAITATDTPTTVRPSVPDLVAAAQRAAREVARLDGDAKNRALEAMAAALRAEQHDVLAANAEDVAQARAGGRDDAFIDRLALTPARIDAIADDLDTIVGLPDPVGESVDARRLPNGLEVARRRVPLGVIAAVFESRPNVAIDISALGLKAGNAVILRGGRESQHSTGALVRLARAALESAGVPADAIQAITNPDRQLVRELLQARPGVDVAVPRGGAGLIEFVTETASVPVLETGWGVCHTFVDAGADLSAAERIVVNAKTRRPSICNALDTLLVDRSVAGEFLPAIGRALADKGVEMHADAEATTLLAGTGQVVGLADGDVDTEWLGLRMSVVVVNGLEEALGHIQTHGSSHSEAIVTRSLAHAERFLDEVDAAAVYVNASTQFTDGGEFGLGAEVGISTQKLHARGPMGLRELTTYKWVVRGDGHVRPL